MKKRALFGGSFDPLHNGHLAVADAALETLCLDELIIVPAFVNPFKTGTHAPAEQRLAWLQKTFADDPRVTISSFEIEQQRPVRSIETVRHFLNEGETLYFIIGADNLASLEQWHAFEELDRLVTWAVATRGDIKIPDGCITLDVDRPVSSTQLRTTMQHHELPEKVAREIAAFYLKKPSRTPAYQGNNVQERLEKISQVLDQNKAESIEVFDLRDRDYFVDFVIIATSLGERHTQALLDYLKKDLKPAEKFLNVDISNEWIVADLGDILVHIMTSEYRNKYDLETFLGELMKERDS